MVSNFQYYKTLEHHNNGKELKVKFKAQYNPVGSTQEQQIKAWKGLEWDPTVESLDGFTYRFIELAEGMGIGQEQRFISFQLLFARKFISIHSR